MSPQEINNFSTVLLRFV